VDVVLGELAHQLVVFGIVASTAIGIVTAQGRLDIGFRSHLQVDFHAEQVLQTIDRVEIGRVGQGNGQAVFVFVNRDHPVLFGNMPRNQGDDFVRDFKIAQIDDFGAEMGSFGLGDVGGTDQFIGQHQVHDTDAGGFGLAPQGSDLVSTDKAEVNQDIY